MLRPLNGGTSFRLRASRRHFRTAARRDDEVAVPHEMDGFEQELDQLVQQVVIDIDRRLGRVERVGSPVRVTSLLQISGRGQSDSARW